MPEVNNDLHGRLALITGASGGIGAAIARSLWSQGCDLALTYATNSESIRELSVELLDIRREGGALHSFHLDCTSLESISHLFAEIKSSYDGHPEGPDILVSNAGYGRRIPDIADITLEEFDHTINVNLRAAFVLSKLSIPWMKSRGWGRIVYVGSIAAQGGGINGCHYAASKAGLQGLMRNLATKHAKDGITVNDVAPAMIGNTGMIPDEKFVEGTPGDVKNIPVGRLGTPQEVANVVLMFCTTGYMTGQSVLLSGGLK
ncbi:3-oxoacyl-reductase FabG [Diplogelasinospora grovesii]|uniref:3-oxoacyl-reductase FabG n=1 Tax=Diplogelasinospora grovesii TaxID=303347 RepID=A0AAN6S3L4_9PEZI|nr:3-oxoacyl-reductase FabG [Diplogelasinospora grovesii]